jgi:peptide chain release factor 2
LEVELQKDGLWDRPEEARGLLQKKELLAKKLESFANFKQSFEDEKELIELADAEGDVETLGQAVKNLEKLEPVIKLKQFEFLFSGEADSHNAFVEFHPGAGGTESHDWAEMLMRMYMRWAEDKGYKVEISDEQRGDEAGIKSGTIKVSGENAYGWLKHESGVHRLVRLSPFNSSSKRMTSFASVWCYPEISNEIVIDIEEKDLRIDTYRASGAGGQHINKTDSAIRITHIPTNIVVQSQNSRSQHRNKDEAMNMLKSRLYELELRKKQDAVDDLNASKTDNSWGNQIRSYVMQPYQMVKDLRSGYETSNVSAVLDGKLDEFMMSLLEFYTNSPKK